MFKIFNKLDLVDINNSYIDRVYVADIPDSTGFIVCYDGPPSVSGSPGVHHILSRTLKDVFCRYKILKGYRVINKAGWDTHGLPVELSVEKDLKITKKDIGNIISVEEYNRNCRESIQRNISKWESITLQHGYCADIAKPYVTCDGPYIESEWWAFKQLYEKGYVYQDYSIQPYSPAAGTGLSSHELNQPGCYKIIKDLTITAMFKSLHEDGTYFLAWTTTPWTLPANSALAVNKDVEYVKIACENKYSKERINVILAKEALERYFNGEVEYAILESYKGSDLVEMKYEPLYGFVKPLGRCFEIISADYVTTTEGTGIVHIAPSFGVDDRRVAKENNIAEITVERGNDRVPIVDEEGKYVKEIVPWAGMYVRREYYKDDSEEAVDVNIEIVKDLKRRGLCFSTEKHEHSYPHCWRTDKPLIYYPLKSWFIRTTAVKDRLIELNRKIKWHPSSTGEGRFKNWLENIVDWNVSRNRFWGVPVPIWITDDGKEMKVIGSFSELLEEAKRAHIYFDEHGLKGEYSLNCVCDDCNCSQQDVYGKDFHLPYIDSYVLVSDSGKKMHRVPGVLDVWFDSGCMPFAQFHYPFENKEEFHKYFPADFICEGVDQTRGWFYTLHVLSTMLFDSIAYKNVVSNGLVLDKNGEKMSKRLGNTIDPFELFAKYGSDPVRFYLLWNTEYGESMRFDERALVEIIGKFFLTLFNIYNFYALYYNSNEKRLRNADVDLNNKALLSGLDVWVLSRLNNLIKSVDVHMSQYSSREAIREIYDFIIDDLSNWYVRLNRKRFSRNDNDADMAVVFSVLHVCLEGVSSLLYPFTPFFSLWMMDNLGCAEKEDNCGERVGGETIAYRKRLQYPAYDEECIDVALEEDMSFLREFVSIVLSLRRAAKIKVRQPLARVLISSQQYLSTLLKYRDIILNETNIKDISFAENVDDNYVKCSFKDSIVAIDTTLTPELIDEGIVREFIREMQKERKELSCSVDDVVRIYVYSEDKSFIEIIKKYEAEVNAEVLSSIVFVEDVNMDDFKPHDGYLVKVIKV